MTDVTPTYQKTAPPTVRELLDSYKREILKEINCAKIGSIVEYFPGDEKTVPLATVKVSFQQVTSISPTGVRTIAEYPLLLHVPVEFTGGGGYSMTYPVKPGDECLVVFNDRELDNWLTSGGGQPPTTSRMHDLSDGVAFVGIRSNPRAIANVSTDAVQLRSDNYTGPTGAGECIDMRPGRIHISADNLNLHGRTKITFDADGTGFVYTPGHIDTYTDGVPSDHHPPNPPEVPT